MTSPKVLNEEPPAPADLMRMAIRLSRRALGASGKNPPVGCVLARPAASGRRVIARGWTGPGGSPHAEMQALEAAGAEAARGAEAYITLEPCAHYGKTPPCAKALIEAGVAHVYVALQDPDPRVNGKGFAMLREAGIGVETGFLAEAAEEVLAPYLMRCKAARPLVTLKLAASLDGKIASASGESQWITGETARRFVHLLRAESDAVMVGANTARQDDPLLTCRLPGLEGQSPLRVIADSGLSLSPESQLVRTAGKAPLLLFAGKDAPPARAAKLRQCGVEVEQVQCNDAGGIEIAAMLAALGRRGIASLLVEGGPGLAASFLQAGRVDRLVWFIAPLLLGARGMDAIAGLKAENLADGFGFAFTRPPARLGEDILLLARRGAAASK